MWNTSSRTFHHPGPSALPTAPGMGLSWSQKQYFSIGSSPSNQHSREAYLHPIRHRPPLAHFRVRAHLFHVSIVVIPNILECSEERAIIIEEDRVCELLSPLPSPQSTHSRVKICCQLTVSDITILDLLEDLGPDARVAFFVGRHCGGLEVHDLGDAAGGGHCILRGW